VPAPESHSDDIIKTVEAAATASILVLGSKFLSSVASAPNAAAAEAHLRERIRRYPDASHHCWAHRIGRPGELIEKSADAGEPSGTAGRPILDSLRSARLENVVCVVTRYFGGTKLGTGGLVRAYTDAATAAIASARLLTRTIVRHVSIDFDHERTGIVYRVLDEFGVTLADARYDERVHGQLAVPSSRIAEMNARLHELAHDGIDWHEAELDII
jgi:uncharacterized YigZ family protein